jgi:Tfp pilus assembly protein PilO
MGSRQRLIIGIVAALAVVGVVWVAFVSPERSKVTSLSAQITTARSTLLSDQGQVAAGEQARDSYPGAVHAVTVLETAAPLSDELPQLIRLINTLEVGHKIKWTSTDVGFGGAGGLEAINLGFSFPGATYSNLQSFLAALDALTRTDGTNVMTKGRLATINSVSLSPSTGGKVAASVQVTFYELPAGASAPVTPGAATTTTAAATP